MTGCIKLAISAAGHDKDTYYALVAQEDGYVLLSDGKHHPLEKPKRKNPKHVIFTDKALPVGSTENNKRLRKALSVIKREALY